MMIAAAVSMSVAEISSLLSVYYSYLARSIARSRVLTELCAVNSCERYYKKWQNELLFIKSVSHFFSFRLKIGKNWSIKHT